MTTWQKISLVLAVTSALFLCGIGIGVSEQSTLIIIASIIGSVITPGVGFMIKKKYGFK